jgi:hypothetical protein
VAQALFGLTLLLTERATAFACRGPLPFGKKGKHVNEASKSEGDELRGFLAASLDYPEDEATLTFRHHAADGSVNNEDVRAVADSTH